MYLPAEFALDPQSWNPWEVEICSFNVYGCSDTATKTVELRREAHAHSRDGCNTPDQSRSMPHARATETKMLRHIPR